MEMVLTFQVDLKDQLIIRTDNYNPVSGSQGYLKMKFIFEEPNTDMVYTPVFSHDGKDYKSEVTWAEDNKSFVCEVPSDAIVYPNMSVSLIGSSTTGKQIITFEKVRIDLKENGYTTTFANAPVIVSAVDPEDPMIKYGDNLGLLPSPYDSRDYHFKDLAPMGAMPIPENYETPHAPFTIDQGRTSMCGACSSTTLRFLQETDNAQSGLTEPFSPAYTYANRVDDAYKGEGMYLRDIAKGYKDHGCCLKSDFPDMGSYIELKLKYDLIKGKLIDKAEPFKISSYYTCGSREEIQTAIMTTKGVIIGIPVFKCFYYPQNGYIMYDKNNGEQSCGGHALLVRGWSTDASGKLYWLIQNSWGAAWGTKDGCCWLPEDYPWQDDAYAYVDDVTEMKFSDCELPRS